MLKNSKIVLFIVLLIISKNSIAFNSSSFLISQSAYNNYDFIKVIKEYNNSKDAENIKNYLDELISAIITDDLILAKKISKKILLKDPNNQEAKLVLMVIHAYNNESNQILKFRLDQKNNKNELFEFIFYSEESVKNNNDISHALLDIVKSSYAVKKSEYPVNYDFLLFYSSLSYFVNSQNDEAIYIKSQLFQIIEKYLQAEINYLKISKLSDFYIDAQRNIALNYSEIYEFNLVEKKIIRLIEKNKQDYRLKKILADIYRIEKKYLKAIDQYNGLIKLKSDDLWHIYFLRGICYERLNDWEIAEKDFLTSLDIKSDSPDVLNYLAYGWLEKDINIEKSFLMLKKAYKTNPNSYYILDSLAWAHFKKNELTKAADLMEKVIDMVPGEAISLDHLGDIYFAMNRKREALYLWQQAIDLAVPEDEIMEKIQDKLKNYNAG